MAVSRERRHLRSLEAVYVEDLLSDDALRFDEFGARRLLESVRESLEREARNPLACGMILLRLAESQVDMAEGRMHSLCRAVETFRRALAVFTAALTPTHQVTLKCRWRLAQTLIRRGDVEAANKELQTILDLKGEVLTIQASSTDALALVATIIGQAKNDGLLDRPRQLQVI